MTEDTRRYLFATWDAGGGLHPLLALAAGLQARGHEVRLLGDPASRAEVTRAGLNFETWNHAPAATSRQPDGVLFRDWEAKGLGGFKRLVDNLAYGPAARHALDVIECCERSPVDVVVAEQFLPGAMVAAEYLGLARCVVVPNLDMRPLRGRPPTGPGFKPMRGPVGRMRDAAVTKVGDRVIQSGRPALNAARSGLHLQPVADVHEISHQADLVLVLTAPSFDWPGTEVPPNTRYVGPVLDDPVWIGEWNPAWPARYDGPIVLVSFGTSYQAQADLYRRAIAAVADLDCRAIVTLGGMFDPAEFAAPDHVVVAGSAPHPPILARADVAVVHGGHSSTMRALSAGVPMVVIPMGRDQNDNAIRVAARNAGIRLSTNASPSRLAKAVRTVLTDDVYRASAEKLGMAIQAETSPATALDELEGITKVRRRSSETTATTSAN